MSKFLRGVDAEGNACLVAAEHISKIMLLKYEELDTREFPFVVSCIVNEPVFKEHEWITLGEYQTEAAAMAKFGELERKLGV